MQRMMTCLFSVVVLTCSVAAQTTLNGLCQDTLPTPGNGAGDLWTNAASGCSKIVFLSSKVYTGNLGGTKGAAQKCQSLAEAAGLAGKYRAWISDATHSPSVGYPYFVQAKVPYVTADGTLGGFLTPYNGTLSSGWAYLTSTGLLQPIVFDENGNNLSLLPNFNHAVWTSTLWDGTNASGGPNNCHQWTDGTSDAGAYMGWADTTADALYGWSYAQFGICNVPAHLYCFQQ